VPEFPSHAQVFSGAKCAMVMQAGATAPIKIFTMDKHTDINLTAIIGTWLVPDHKARFPESMSTNPVAQVWCATFAITVFLPTTVLQGEDLWY
jgi:hypothetical protein